LRILDINIKEAGYGKKIILKDVSISIEAEKITAFIGPNGAGKSTLLKSIMGTADIKEGKIFFNEEDITILPVEDKVKKRILFVPQGNKVFADLSVYENLETGGYLIKDKKELKIRIEESLSIFPLLQNKLKQDAGDLSGGEKQQLALARALILKPEILMLDEPSLGLAPQLVNSAFNIIKGINKRYNCSILIVEQKVHDVLNIADYVYGLRLGKIAFEGTALQAKNEKILKKIFLL
jgi:branched-chain amino acid transport system ATP-binding protein